MSEETLPTAPAPDAPEESTESFGELFAEFERTHSRKSADDNKQLEGTVVSLDAEFVYLDIGFKTEGILPRTAFPNNADDVAVGATFPVSVKGRNVERYYELSRIHIAQPKDWSSPRRGLRRENACLRCRHRSRQGRLQRRRWRPRLHARIAQRR